MHNRRNRLLTPRRLSPLPIFAQDLQESVQDEAREV
jgi:hypothetical protein